MTKKILASLARIILIVVVILTFFVNYSKIDAKTVNDLKKELDTLQKEAEENQNKIQYTQDQINQAKNNISRINKEMADISAEIIQKTNEIAELNQKIKDKDKEIKELMAYIQISNGYPFYLEYIMGAQSLTDFIYRTSVTEQLSEYNSKLITDMNSLIKANEKKKIELNDKSIELDKKQEEIVKDLSILASQKIQLDENDRSLADEIVNAKAVIKMYADAGCKDFEDLTVCANRLIPSDTGFIRPITNGYITSEFGYRYDLHDNHYAVDMSTYNKASVNIYPVANGKVAKIFYDPYGGNQVVIHHKIISNGIVKYYSSTYVHLKSVYVKDGTIVTRDTVIGLMGNIGNVYPRPTASDPYAGTHLHLAISTGLRYKDYVSYYDYIAHSFNPRNVINFPSKGVYWSNRTTRY